MGLNYHIKSPSQHFMTLWRVNCGNISCYEPFSTGRFTIRKVDMSKILLVDDDEFVVEYLKAHLEEWGYDVLGASGGRSAIDMAVSETPGLIIMDINMPGVTGYEVIAELKGNPQTAGIPIVALTANKTAEDRDHAYEIGCEGYISKPIVDVDVIRNTVRRILGEN